MTDSNYTHLLLIVDRSGSMQSIAHDMNGGIAHLLADQFTLPGELAVDAWTFDNRAEQVATNVSADNPILNELVQPRGGTALYDAIGKAVTDLGATLSSLHEEHRPSRVIVVIATDGEENASREWTAEGVKSLVDQQQDTYGWSFVFLGANIDSFAVGGNIGLRGASTMDYMPTAQGVSAVFESTSRSMNAYRSGAAASIQYSEADRQAAKPSKKSK